MFLVCKNKTLIICVVVLLIVCGIFGVALAGVQQVFAEWEVPIYSVETVDNKVALTFDAAWGSDKTRLIMDILEQNGYKGTFFLTGFWIDANATLVQEIYARGHQIANHSENHKHLKELSVTSMTEEIDVVNEKIENLIGEKATCYRAPFGEYDNKLLNVLKNKNMQCIQWSIDSLDWKGISGSEICKRVQNKLQRGDIVLFHNNSEHILDALPLIMLSLKNKNLTAVRVDELIYKENFIINNQGKQIKNS